MRKRLSPGMILGVIAVVLACTGSATAGSLITSGKIKDGTIRARDIKKGSLTSDRFAASVRSQLRRTGTPGAQGAKGDKGDAGATGASGPSVLGSPPQKGDKGDTGPAGKDGANPATLVAAAGDAAWAPVGGGTTTAPFPKASFSGGELRLQGGFDASTPSGAIGLGHQYDNVALSSLKALSYDFRVIKRPAGNIVSAPTIHITLLKAATGTPSGFTNLVFEPYMQGDFGLNQRYSVDAMAGKWWATRKAGTIEHAHPGTWADVIAQNPDATISGIAIDNGGTSSGTIPADQFAAGVDTMLVGFGTEFTRFDFGG
jgi:hypothetical protein